MILDTTALVNITSRNVTYFKEKGYDISETPLQVKINDLNRYSRTKINIECDECYKSFVLSYNKYMDNFERYGFYTCKKCSYTKKKITNNKNFGVDNPMELEKFKNKGKKTKLDRYGNENYNNLEKHIETNLKLFGVKHHLQNNDILNKQKETNLKKYGFESASQSIIVKNKIKKSLIISKFKSSIELYKDKYDLNIIDKINYDFKIKCEKCESIYFINPKLLQLRIIYNNTLCTICNPIGINNTSEPENLLYDFILNNYEGTIIKNSKKIIPPYELDIYLPDLKIAFEFNGLYWHNELYKPFDYHKMKSDLCEEKEIQLIQIYEDDWAYKQDIVKSMILNKLGKTPNKIYARKCQIKEINNNKLIKKFLIDNHIQGFVNSSIKLGLFYNDELVSLMTFGKLRKLMNMKSVYNTCELIRFCNKLNTNIIGGASKLFKYFLNNFKEYENIISYANRDYSNGNLYKQLGFNLDKLTPPNHYYIINNERKHRFNFRKSELIKQGFDLNKTGQQIMLERKIYRIYNSGNYKFEYKKQI